MRAQVVLLREGKVLMARHQRSGRTYWVLPGGEIEPGETPDEAAIREVWEETGLHVHLERLLYVEEASTVGGVAVKYPRHTFLGSVVGGQFEPGRDIGSDGQRLGDLVGAEWLAWSDKRFDRRTRQTLDLVTAALGDEGPSIA